MVSKKQATFEIIVFDAKFFALENEIETLQGLCHKLEILGVPILGLSYICDYNKEFTLTRKNNLVCYHFAWKSV